MSKERFNRRKSCLTIGTIGHAEHGKTTLTAAIRLHQASKRLADFRNIDEVNGDPERQQGLTIDAPHIEYETERRHYTHLDCPGHSDYIKKLIVGGVRMDAAILVVNAAEGTMPQTREHILFACQLGVRCVIVYLNKVDIVNDEGVLELVELEVRELLSKYGFPGTTTPIIRGSALKALEGELSPIGTGSIERLLVCIDEYVPEPLRSIDKPFLMPINEVFSITGKGIVGTGYIERGTLRVGENIELIGSGQVQRGTVTGIEIFHKFVDMAVAGDTIGCLLTGVTKEQIEKGMVIAKPNTIRAFDAFKAMIHFIQKDEGKKRRQFFNGQTLKFCIRTSEVCGLITLLDGIEMVMPGDTITATIRLQIPIAIEENLRFTVREGVKEIAAGVVTMIL